MSGEEIILKKELMVKRARMRRKITSWDNYRARWFILTPTVLKYFDGSLEKGVIGHKKGELDLRFVHAVEFVDCEALDGRDNGFQVVFSEDYNILYIIAQSERSRNEWVDLLRETCHERGVQLDKTYHPGVWYKERFSCCDATRLVKTGCTTSPYYKPQEVSDNRRHKPLPIEPSDQVKKDQFHVIALYDYDNKSSSCSSGELRLVRGEEYLILNNSDDNWWRARNKKGDIGYIPANYVQVIKRKDSVENLEEYEWYFGEITLQKAELLLKECGVSGSFLVRNSRKNPGQCTLSVLFKESPDNLTVRHYRISVNEVGQYYFSENHLEDTIGNLINYHSYNAGGLVSRLLNPLCKNKASPSTSSLVLDKWELDRRDLELGAELGKGQFGRVVKAKWQRIYWVAVKMLQPNAMDENAFIDEAKVMQSMRHPHLVQLYGVVIKSKPLLIVTELMPHGSLHEYLHRHCAHLSKGVLLNMCVQVCKAMQYLESRGFIHRDLAARNCLVGDGNVVKVADFGLTRFVLDDEYLTTAGSKFPIKWSPPEVLLQGKFSTKSDVWAFGVLVWEIFTGGEIPYRHIKNRDLQDFICNKKQRLPQPAACTDFVYQVMLTTWQVKPDDRPTFSDLLYSLEAMLKHPF